MKKFISMALALVMALSLCTVFDAPKADATFADADELSSQYAEQAADVIQKIEVMDGYDDGTFRPTAGLTRQAAAKIICNMILGPTTAKALPTNANPFPDVLAGNQFSGYISYCAQQGIISGYSDGTFRGGDPLSGYAYLKMLLGALGYDARHEGFVGDNWRVNVAKIALGIGLNNGVDDELDGTTQVTREAAAIYAFNTLQADMVEYESKNTIEINGVQVSMGGGNAVPQTWSTSATQASNINDARSDGDGNARGNNIVQFAERYFDKLERFPKQWDTYTQDDFGRPSIKWKWKGVDVGTYSRDPDATFVGGVDVNVIYDALRENTGMSSGSSSASLYVNSANANRGWYENSTGDYTGNPTGYGEFKVERANDRGLGDEIARTTNASGDKTLFTASTNDREGGRTNSNGTYIGRNVDRIGDGTLIEVFRNDATNHVDVCVISVYGGKVDAVKGATSKKDAYVVLSTNHNAFPDRYPDTIGTPANREFETEDFEEDDVVAFTYSDSAKEIKSVYLMSAESGALQSKVTGKSLRLGTTTYKYGKEYTFDDLSESSLGNKSSYIVYLDENDFVLWVEEDEFSVEDYVLIERITIETSVTDPATNRTVTTKTASVLGTAATTADVTTGTNQTLPQNCNALQVAYNQSKDAVGNSSWDAQAQVRYSTGVRRTVTLDDSKNYRTSAISDAYYRGTVGSSTVNEYNGTAWVDRVATVGFIQGQSGDDGNWIAYPFTAGRIVRISSNSSGYRLHSIADSRYKAYPDVSLSGNRLYSGTSRLSYDLDSETHFVIEDNEQGSYKSYVGVKNAPTVLVPSATVRDSNGNSIANIHYGDNPSAFVYLDGSTAKLVFITNAWDVSNSSNDIVFLVANSTSNEVESDDGIYYEVNAVDKNEIKTLFVKKVTDANGRNTVSFTGRIFNGNTYTFTPGVGRTEQKYRCVILNNIKYDSNDFVTSGNFNASDDTATRYHGIRRVNDEEVRVNTYFSTSTLKDVAENVRVYFVDGDNIEQIDYDEIVNDTTDYVYLVEDDDGEVTYIFIVDYDGSDDDSGVDSTTPAPAPTTYADGTLQDTSNGQATAYTLHLSSPSTALPAVSPVTVQQYVATHSGVYATTATTVLQYNAALSSTTSYVFDWMVNGNASGIQVTITVATDAVASAQPTTSGS